MAAYRRGLWFTSPADWLPRTGISSGTLRSVIEYGPPLPSFLFTIGYPSESVSSSKWHAWFASRCPGRRLSTWPTTAVSCPTALGALCSQLTFPLAWCRQHSAVTATELLQPRDLACKTVFQSSCVIPTSPTDCYDDSWRDTFFVKHELEHGALWLLICGAIEKHLLTYLAHPAMAMVDEDGSCQLSADSQPKSIALVWGSVASRRSVCIHQMNRVNTHNDFGHVIAP